MDGPEHEIRLRQANRSGRAEPVVVREARPAVLMMAVEEFDRLVGDPVPPSQKGMRARWQSRQITMAPISASRRNSGQRRTSCVATWSPLTIFLKFISDAFEAKRAELLKEDLADAEDPEE